MERRIKIKTLNPHITCKICKGYLIDATTVTECLHTFCKSCLVKHLEENNTCPTCQIVIHQSHPLQYISYDRTLQDIVYKLVPNLQNDEIRREKEFCATRSLPYSKSENGPQAINQTSLSENTTPNYNYHLDEEQVGVELVPYPDCSLKQIKQRYVKCSANLTIITLKKMISQLLFKNPERHKDIDLLYNQELLGLQHTLKFVLVTRWAYKRGPLPLFYKLSKNRDF